MYCDLIRNEDFKVYIYSFLSEKIIYSGAVLAFLIISTSQFYTKISLLYSLLFIFCYLYQEKIALGPSTAWIRTNKNTYKFKNKNLTILSPSNFYT